MGNTTSLSLVDLSGNAFTGSIPVSFCSLDVTEINIKSTKITGAIHEKCCGSLNLKRDNSWFVEEAIECTCCDGVSDCYMWSINAVVEEGTTHPPCPTKNIYIFDYFWNYRITDLILDQEMDNFHTQNFMKE